MLCATPAWAIRRDEIPDKLRKRLPEFVLTIIDPRALAALSLADLEEFADAYDSGELRFINDCRIEGRGGPLTDEQAMGILQCMPGAPYIEARFIRQVKWAYGRGIFSSLRWEVHNNADDSIDIHLWYESRDPSFVSPEVSYDGIAGVLLGATYQDLYYGGKDRQLRYGAQFNGKDIDEPRLFGSYDDNTLKRGRASLSLSGGIASDWHTRHSGRKDGARLRDRVARLDAAYSENSGMKLLGRRASVVARGGLYHQEDYVLAGDPTRGDPAPPRADLDQDGTALYAGIGLSAGRRDQLFTPQSGYSYRLDLQQHVGDFTFTEASADFRRYVPARNILGLRPVEHLQSGERYDARELLPSASVAWQVQAALQDGDVPYSEELIPGGSRAARGYSYSRYSATKLLAARAEYRMKLDRQGSNEAFVYSDNAWSGERIDKLEALNSVGVGGLFTLPIYGGIKLGAWYGRALSGEDYSYGLAFGYQF